MTSGTARRTSQADGRVGTISTRIVSYDELNAEEREAWHRLRDANPALASPYFHPGFARAVHASGHAVQVVVGRDDSGEVRVLLPCHRERSRLRPVGWPGADFQGPIAAPGTSIAPLGLLTDGARSYEFDHLVDAYPDLEPWVMSRQPSPYLDTTDGLTGYLGRASSSGKDNMGQARRKAAKAERAYGTVRFTADAIDDDALDRLVEMKRAQYAATGARDYFAEPYRHEMLTRLLHTRGTEFAGVLSTLYAGPHLIAAHFGIRAGAVLHWWFPVYDPDFASFAPGWIILRELVMASPSLGIERIDLGRGDDEYKRRAKTGEVLVGQGIVSNSTARLTARRTRDALVAAAKASPLGPGLRAVVRKLR